MKLAIIIMLILSLPFAYAETQIFSGKIITGSEKTIDGGSFKFTYDENSKKAFVQTPAGGLIVERGACKPNKVFRVCVNSANFSHKDINTYVFFYEIDATIYKLTGSLKTSSKATSPSLLQNEQNEIAVTITNPTDFEITSIVFNYDLKNFSIVEANGCELDGKMLTWKGSLQPKYDKTCAATIYSEKEGKYTLSGNLSYFNGYEAEKKTIDALSITVMPKQLKFSQLIDKDIGIKKPFYLNISLLNIHQSEEIRGFSEISLPSHVSLIKESPLFDKNGKILKRSLILSPNSGINYSLYLEKNTEGNSPISLNFKYSIKGISEEVDNVTYVDVDAEMPLSNQPAETNMAKANDVNVAMTSQTADENITKTGPKIQNNSDEKVIFTNFERPKQINKNFLLLAIAVATSFMIVTIVIFKIRKNRKKDGIDELKEELNSDESKPF